MCQSMVDQTGVPGRGYPDQGSPDRGEGGARVQGAWRLGIFWPGVLRFGIPIPGECRLLPYIPHSWVTAQSLVSLTIDSKVIEIHKYGLPGNDY